MKKAILIIFICIVIAAVFYIKVYLPKMNDYKVVSEDLFTDEENNQYIKKTYSEKISENYLILISDVSSGSTDTIMILNFNEIDKSINLLSIPRDTYIESNYSNKKANALFVKKGGDQILIDALNDKFNLGIEYYASINIKVFREIIDLLDGVDYNIPIDMKYDDPYQDLHIDFKKGMQHLDGKLAENFLRFRKPNSGKFTEEMKEYYNGSDISRISMQQDFLKEFLKQKSNIKYLPKIDNIIKKMFENIKTNIELNMALKLSTSIKGSTLSTINTFVLKGIDKRIDNLAYWVVDMDSANSIINTNFNLYSITKLK